MRKNTSGNRALLVVGTLALLGPPIAAAGQVSAPGRVEFDFLGSGPANIEIDLKDGMLSTLTDIAIAAVDGAAEGVRESGQVHNIQKSSEMMGAARELLGLTGMVVQEVRLRIYEGLEDPNIQDSMQKHYQEKLNNGNWERVVKVREGDESVVVCVHREGSAIRGVFVMVGEGSGIVLANVVCDLTPENIRQLTKKATKVGMQFGLGDTIDQVVREVSP